MNKKSDARLLVVSAHAADYVWRAGGTIASYLEMGAAVKVVVLSFGVRGESNDLWNVPEQTSENVAKIRENETRAAADILGVRDIEFWNIQDYPFQFTQQHFDRMVYCIREFRPTAIITHGKNDVLNPDHNKAYQLVFECSVAANSAGVLTPDLAATKQMQLFGFEPHQTEISGYIPDIFIDISGAYEKKARAMECFEAQPHLIRYYKERAGMRGNHARRISGEKAIQYAESFSSHFPVVSKTLPPFGLL